jgi:hypothetical protein
MIILNVVDLIADGIVIPRGPAATEYSVGQRPLSHPRTTLARRDVMAELKGRTYSIHVHHGLDGVDPVAGNVDVEVRFDDGSPYAATFFTLSNLRLIFEKNEQTGDCKGGLYLWASNMVIVRELTETTISETVADLVAQGEFEGAFSKLTSNAQRTPKSSA